MRRRRASGGVLRSRGQLYNIADDHRETPNRWARDSGVVAEFTAELDAIRKRS